ncbi:hypothetical protein PACTADRAFT_48022 [Pachysolen tannophilus NRRL Y-2460]|uniref:ABC transporter domain-containing protein n=1 Tax=Pachysolen tannophilus NRRL Y-2460 TaxID=669874 RepID=A0A1E4U2J0_PACTA|nr:hypothetical protein PACTADRAFT_48022 [Pachysolen tannophilus NRRL Y-2460]
MEAAEVLYENGKSEGLLYLKEEDRIRLTVRKLVVSLTNGEGKKNKKRKFVPNFLSSRRRQDKKYTIDIEANDNFQKIVNDVNIEVNPGEIVAILGASGSGKTTLLNTLSQRVTSNASFQFRGMIKYNSTSKIENIRYSYMLQSDFFLPNLTVLETLQFAADLKLPKNFSKQDKKLLINTIIDQLGLSRIQNSMILSNSGTTNLSGGEQRLVSLALQLLNKPGLLFLDEPTTGLDSTSSYRLLSVLHTLAKSLGISIILTIHQPRYEILEKLDKLTILAKGGNVIYYGKVESSIEYFAQLGYECPSYTNLTDFILDLSVKDVSSEEAELKSSLRVERLIQKWKSYENLVLNNNNNNNNNNNDNITYVDTFCNKDENNVKQSSKNKISIWKEIKVLTKRTFILSVRDTYSLSMLLGSIIVMAFACGWLFYKPTPDIAGIRTIESQLYVMQEVVGFVPLFFEISRLCSADGKAFYREKNEGIISVFGWLVSRRIAKFFVEDFAISLIFSVISYFMWGLRTEGSASYFLIFFSNALLVNLTGMTCAMLCFALGTDFSTASLVSNLFYQLQNNGGGFFVNSKSMPVYVRWVKYISYFWYSYGALASNQFSNWRGDCIGTDEECLEYTGEYILKTLGFSENFIKLPISILVAWCFCFYAAAGIILKYKNTDVTMSKPKVSKLIKMKSGPNEKEETITQEHLTNGINGIDITLKDIQLWVMPKTFQFGIFTILYEWAIDKFFKKKNVTTIEKLEKKKNSKKLLNNISASFKSGKVNAILGPSGSGKSTLLNLLAGRLSKNYNFISSGEFFINNAPLKQGTSFGKFCSYVLQHDTHLIPNLTVKETLYFQAKLRLPKELKDDDTKLNNIVDDLINKIGLKDCENILIGDELNKGLSGGEKKRVSIAIQLLDKSRILLLDEPTSGLDSFTASQILELLNQLATEDNKTIILTIHQPKAELFNHFGNILLLSRGGNVVYNDNIKEISTYFQNLGFECPKMVNIADFVLDLVSQNVDEDLKTSNDRVKKLINSWSEKQNNKVVNSLNTSGEYQELSNLIIRKSKSSFTDCFVTVTKRQMLTMFRNPNVIFCRVIQVLGLGVLQALFFSPLSNSADSISNRLGLIQEVMNLYYVGFINNVTLYPTEKNYFYSDYTDQIYDIEAFFFAYLSVELPSEILTSAVFAVLVSIVPGLPRTAEMYFTTFYVSFICINTGESLGIIINTCFDKLEIAVNVLANIMIVVIFMAGTMSLTAPKFFKAWNYISPLKYSVGSVSKLAFENQEFVCEVGDSCSLHTGNAVLQYYGLNCDYKTFMGALAVVLVAYRILSYLSLCLKLRMSR